MQAPDSIELRRLALAVSVLDDVDLVPHDDGVLLTGVTPVEVSWLELRRAVAGAPLDSIDVDVAADAPGEDVDDTARARVRAWLRGRRMAADTHPDHLREQARPVGLPIEHPMHPGLDWVRERVMGGALDLGLGFVGIGADPDEVVVVPQGALEAAGIDPTPWWPAAKDYLERMGALAANRLATNPILRPIGDCDVVTLLASRALRTVLCAEDSSGMRAAAVPMRRRGWLDLTRIDPSFTAAAAAATAPEERGFPRPVLLTVDEVCLAPSGGRPAEIVLRDPAADAPHLRPMLFR